MWVVGPMIFSGVPFEALSVFVFDVADGTEVRHLPIIFSWLKLKIY
jgi:hypothetical protein